MVTGDRDLFQVVDDNKGCGFSTPPVGWRRCKSQMRRSSRRSRVTPGQYADMAALRGDPVMACRVCRIGEKTAASLLRRFGDLAGCRQRLKT